MRLRIVRGDDEFMNGFQINESAEFGQVLSGRSKACLRLLQTDTPDEGSGVFVPRNHKRMRTNRRRDFQFTVHNAPAV